MDDMSMVADVMAFADDKAMSLYEDCLPSDFNKPEFPECEGINGAPFEKVNCMAKKWVGDGIKNIA